MSGESSICRLPHTTQQRYVMQLSRLDIVHRIYCNVHTYSRDNLLRLIVRANIVHMLVTTRLCLTTASETFVEKTSELFYPRVQRGPIAPILNCLKMVTHFLIYYTRRKHSVLEFSWAVHASSPWPTYFFNLVWTI